MIFCNKTRGVLVYFCNKARGVLEKFGVWCLEFGVLLAALLQIRRENFLPFMFMHWP